MNEYQSVYEVAEQLGIYPGRIYRAHRMGRVPEPLRVGTARLYTAEDVERLRAYFTSQRVVKEEMR